MSQKILTPSWYIGLIVIGWGALLVSIGLGIRGDTSTWLMRFILFIYWLIVVLIGWWFDLL